MLISDDDGGGTLVGSTSCGSEDTYAGSGVGGEACGGGDKGG